MEGDWSSVDFYQVKVTEVFVVNSFLKIFGQNTKSIGYLKLRDLEQLYGTLNTVPVSCGDVCLLKAEGDFFRCRVVATGSEKAQIYLIDCGFYAVFPVNYLRRIPETNNFYKMPPVCKDFYIGRIMVNANEDGNKKKIETKMRTLLVKKSVQLSVPVEIKVPKTVSLADIEINGEPLFDIVRDDSELKDVIKSIGLLDQLNQLSTAKEPSLERRSLPASPDEKSEASTQKTAKIMYAVGSEHLVTINHSKASAKEFFVSFNESEGKFNEFENSMRDVDLGKFTEMPSIGSNCIILLPLDETKFEAARSIVKSIEKDRIMIYLVDRGEEMETRLSQLYASTVKWVNDMPPFAATFSLYDADKVTHLNDEERDFYFRYLVHQRKLKLTVRGVRNEIPECSLKDITYDQDILSMMQAYDPHSLAYPEQIKLTPGKHKVMVSAAQSPQDFYVTLYGDRSIAAIYGKQLKTLNACELKCPSPGNVCYIKFHEKFYRAKHLKRVSPKVCEVLLVDLGIVCKVNHEDIRVMVESQLKDAPAAYHCSLSDSSDFDADYFKDEKLFHLLNNQAVIQVNDYKDQKYYVKILAAGNECEPSKLWAQLENFGSTIPDKSERGVCQISYVSSINCFTIQQVSKMSEMEDAIKLWQQIITNIKVHYFTQRIQKKNRFILKDKWNKWVRVELFRNDNGITIMRNIDDGYLIELDKSVTIFDAPVDVLLMKPFGILCTLPCHIKKHHDQEANEFLMNYVGKNLTYKLMANRSGVSVIELYDGDKSLVREMEKLNFVKRHAVLVSSSGFISHIESLREFYIHQEDDGNKMRSIIHYAKNYQQEKVSQPWKNMIVMARHKPDSAWNRARILRKVDGKFQIHFIDFGDRATFDQNELGLIPDEWVYKSSPLAFKCALDLPADLNEESMVALDRFIDFAFISLGTCRKLRSFIDSTEKLSRKVNFKFIRNEMDLSSVITILDEEDNDFLIYLRPVCEKIELKLEVKRNDDDHDYDNCSVCNESDFEEIFYENNSTS